MFGVPFHRPHIKYYKMSIVDAKKIIAVRVADVHVLQLGCHVQMHVPASHAKMKKKCSIEECGEDSETEN